MRVAQIGVAHPYRGGIAHYTTSLHHSLLQRGHDSFVVSFSRLYPWLLFPGKSQFDASERHFSIDSQRLIDSLNPLSWSAAARRILDQKPDAVVVQYWHPYFAPAFRAIAARLRAGRIPVVLICHNVVPHEWHPVATFLRDRLFAQVERFLVHADKDRRLLEALRPGARVFKAQHPVYHFFEAPTVTRESARESLGLAREDNVILFFGHVRPYKGLDILLRSLPRVLNRQKVRLLIAGEFYESRNRYDRLLRNLGLHPYVVVHDRYVPNEMVATYFRAANLLALPYRAATQSGIVPTAYLFDLPVVTTSVGGLPEAVLDGKTGFLVPPENPAALAEAIVDYFQAHWEAPCRDQIRRFKQQFSWSTIADGIEDLVGAAEGRERALLQAR